MKQQKHILKKELHNSMVFSLDYCTIISNAVPLELVLNPALSAG